MISYEDDYRVRTWSSSAKYHREHGHPTAAKLAAEVADAIRFYLLHLASPGFVTESAASRTCPLCGREGVVIVPRAEGRACLDCVSKENGEENGEKET